MKKQILIIAILILGQMQAQTGIGTTTPNASAKLDVYATNKGFLPPRVTLTSTTDATTIASPAEGLLVYNLGSVGLQAGYYYWNNANWATIATATSAGNGVTSSDLVKLYGEAHSSAAGKISSSTGYVFTVPVSGRYLFDFTSGATTLSGGINTIYFQVRQGTTVLASDTQSSYNNNVHVEYNGKLEVNLLAGVSYNIYNYATSGSFEANDYDRVYYKMVAGNLPVTGQTVEYGMARYTGADGGAMGGNTLVTFDATAVGNLPWSGNKFTLKANKTYEVESSLAIYQTGGGVGGRFQIYDYTNNVALANGLFMSQNGAGTNNPSANSPMKGIVTPTTDIQVGIRLLDWYGPAGPGIVGSASNVQTSPNASYFMVTQIGSSAIVNPWTLAGTNTYNTTGNVGIGVAAPSTNLHIENGNVFGANPASTTSPSLYLYNNNNASTSAHATALVRTGGLNGGKPYIGMDVINQFGYSMGINNPTDQFIFNTTWNFATGTAGNNAITINRSGRSRVMIPEQAGSINTDWPAWGGGLATYDICAASIYASNYVTRSDIRLKNSITSINSNDVEKYLGLRPVTFYWNQDKPRDPSLQYGLIAQEVEKLFPEMVTTADDSMQTKSVNYQALHALSLKVIQSQQQEIEAMKKKQAETEQRLLQLEAKLNK